MEETWVLKTWRRHGCLKHGGGKNGEQIGAGRKEKEKKRSRKEEEGRAGER